MFIKSHNLNLEGRFHFHCNVLSHLDVKVYTYEDAEPAGGSNDGMRLGQHGWMGQTQNFNAGG